MALVLPLPHCYASNKSVPLHLLFLTENTSLNIFLFFHDFHTLSSHTQKPQFGTFAFHLLSLYVSHAQTLKMQLQICGQAPG